MNCEGVRSEEKSPVVVRVNGEACSTAKADHPAAAGLLSHEQIDTDVNQSAEGRHFTICRLCHIDDMDNRIGRSWEREAGSEERRQKERDACCEPFNPHSAVTDNKLSHPSPP